MKSSLRTALFVSAFSPALISLALVKIQKNLWEIHTEEIQLIIIGSLGLLIPIFIMRLAKGKSETFPIVFKKIEANDFMLFAFIASYILPFMMKSSELSTGIVIVILCAICIILSLVSFMPAHPILRLMGYHFYKAESSTGIVYALLTKKKVLDPKQIKKVICISDTMLIEEEEF